MIKFTKYHGLGNDFIIVNSKDVEGKDYSQLAVQLCDRHIGIGADGLIIVDEKDIEMIFYNQDGTRAGMCGNGIRCFVKYLYDERLLREKKYDVKTLVGLYNVELISVSPFLVRVNMGTPVLETGLIPMGINKDKFINEIIETNKGNYNATSLNMGVPHTVLFFDSIGTINMKEIGSIIENNKYFPKKTNVNFVEVIDKTNIKARTFERGAGLTLACGTGACASVVAGQLNGKLDNNVTVRLPLGKLFIENIDKTIYLTGPCEKICDGNFI